MPDVIERYHFDPKRGFIKEAVALGRPRLQRANHAFVQQALHESKSPTRKEPLPDVIYPLIHAIHANVVTRNNTRYPEQSLIGNPEEGTGYTSFLFPYPTPWIRDHNSSGGCMGDSSETYGRTKKAWWQTEATGGGFIAAIPGIYDPYAIERILDGRFLTVSIGSSTDSIICSICGLDLLKCTEEERYNHTHEKGQRYKADENAPEQLCWWDIGPIKNHEVSFVHVPSDWAAGVADPNVPQESFSILAGDPTREYLFDLNDPARKNRLASDNPIIASEALDLLEASKEDYRAFHNTRTIFVITESADEAKLTGRQRKSLPDSAFALVYTDKKTGKKVRRFPIHDLTHAQKALQMLPKAKGLTPAQRAQVKTKAQAALKRFSKGKKEQFTPAQWNEIELLLADYAEDADQDQGQPVQVEIDDANYPLLLGVIEDLEDELDEALEMTEQQETTIAGLRAELEAAKAQAGRPAKEDAVPDPVENAEETQPEVTEEEAPAVSEAPAAESAQPAPAPAVTETRTVAQMQELLDASNTALTEAETALTNSLVTAVSALQLALNASAARGKTFEQLVERNSKRGKEYLLGVLEDLSEDAKRGPVVRAEELEHADNPVAGPKADEQPAPAAPADENAEPPSLVEELVTDAVAERVAKDAKVAVEAFKRRYPKSQ